MKKRTKRPQVQLTDQSHSSGRPSPKKKWTRRSDERPSDLVAAALRLFAARGFAATRLEDVAAEAGVSKGTVYLYFESKERLFEAVIRESVTPRIDQASAMLEAFEGSTASLLRTLMTVFETTLNSPVPAVMKLILAESGNFPELARLWAELAAGRVLGLVARVIERGVARGELRPVEPAQVAPLIMAPVLFLGLWKQSLAPHTDLRIDPRALLTTHVEVLLGGLSATPPAPSAKKGKR